MGRVIRPRKHKVLTGTPAATAGQQTAGGRPSKASTFRKIALSAQRKKDLYDLSLRQVDKSDHSALERHSDKYVKGDVRSENIRLKPVLRQGTLRGRSYDEMFQTRALKRYQRGADLISARLLFAQRAPNDQLIWAVDKGAKKRHAPLAGHTPSIAQVRGDKKAHIVTTEHGTRDRLRQAAHDVEPEPMDKAIKARLATIKYMSDPAERLKSVAGEMRSQKFPLFANYKDIGDLRNRFSFNAFLGRQQAFREKLKWETAAFISTMGHGREKLLPADYVTALGAHGNDPAKAMKAFHQEARGRGRTLNRASTSQTDDLTKHTLSQMVATRQRALSPPRDPKPSGV